MGSKLKTCTVSPHLTSSIGPATLSEATSDETDFTIADWYNKGVKFLWRLSKVTKWCWMNDVIQGAVVLNYILEQMMKVLNPFSYSRGRQC